MHEIVQEAALRNFIVILSPCSSIKDNFPYLRKPGMTLLF